MKKARIYTSFSTPSMAYLRDGFNEGDPEAPVFTPGISTHNGREVALVPLEIAGQTHSADGSKPQQFFALVIDFESETTIAAAVNSARVDLQRIIDLMTFRTLVPIQVISVEARDVSQPVSVGDVRTVQFFSGGVLDRGLRGASVKAGDPLSFSDLNDASALDATASSALAWFVKAVATRDTIDQFIALWVCLELLIKMSGNQVREPTTCSVCNARFPECPSCGVTWSLPCAGRTVIEYLSPTGNLDTKLAMRQWRMRQVFHGERRFETSDFNDLPELVITLRPAVVLGLKLELGLGEDQLPNLEGGMDMGAPSLRLSTALREVDLVPLGDLLHDDSPNGRLGASRTPSSGTVA